jgi:chromate reductase
MDKDDLKCEIIDFTGYDLPSFNERFLDRDEMSDFQKKMVDSWAKSDLIIVLSPEYNWFPTAELINTVNHMGSEKYKDLWDNKVFAFAGVSAGRGGRMPAVQLTYVFNKIISYTHSKSICSPKIYESHFTAKDIDRDGKMKEDSDTKKAIERFIDYNVDMAKRWKA